MNRLIHIILLVLLPVTGAWSHPHNWISLATTMVIDTNNRLIEISQSWEFDEFYSMITASDLLNEYPSTEVGFNELASQMKTNLAGYNYFSNLTINEQNVEIPVPELAKIEWNGNMPTGKMILKMTFRFKEALSITNKELTWSVYDPTYYIAMNHDSVAEVSIVGGQGLECGKELILPNPSDETIDYAASLDRSQRDTQGLGQLFAERVVVKCL